MINLCPGVQLARVGEYPVGIKTGHDGYIWTWGTAVLVLDSSPPGNMLPPLEPVTIQPAPHGASRRCIAALYSPGNELVPVLEGNSWTFKLYTEEKSRVSNTYDAEAFERHVDMAIAQLRTKILDEREDQPAAQPHIRQDSTPGEVLVRTVLVMVQREVSGGLFEGLLNDVFARTKRLLLQRNLAYGDSALSPVRIYSKASLKEQLLVRIDDKISRIVRGQNAGEDVAGDLMGYFVLLTIAEIREAEAKPTEKETENT